MNSDILRVVLIEYERSVRVNAIYIFGCRSC